MAEQKQTLYSFTTGGSQQGNIYGKIYYGPKMHYFIQCHTEIKEQVQEDDIPKQIGIREPIYNFTGREEQMQKIDNFFSKGDRKVLIMGIEGIGKTQLVRKYVSINKEKFEYILWINAETERDMEESFHNVASKLKILVPKNGENRKIDLVIQDVFSKINDTRSLIVYDNAESHQMLEKFLPPKDNFSKNNLHVLITSKTQYWFNYNTINIFLHNLNYKDSVSLVKNTLKIKHNFTAEKYEELVIKIVEINQGLPQGLTLGMAFIENHNDTEDRNAIEDYLIKFYEMQDDSYKNSPFEFDEETLFKVTIYSIYKMILEKIEEISKETLYFLQICSYLNPNGIEKKFLYHFFDKEIVHTSIEILTKFSLMESDDNLVYVHRLISELTRYVCIYNNDCAAYKRILEFNLNCNYLIQLNPVNLVSSDRFFKCLTTIRGHYIFRYADKHEQFILKFYEELQEEKKIQFFALLVYYGCPRVTRQILQKKTITEINFQTLDITHMNNFISNFSASYSGSATSTSEQYCNDKPLLEFLSKHTYKGSIFNIACIQGHEQIVGYMAAHGANVNEKNNFGIPLVHCVLHNDYTHCCRILVERNASVHAKDDIGTSLSHIATKMGHKDIIEYLTRKGMVVDENDPGDTVFLTYRKTWTS